MQYAVCCYIFIFIVCQDPEVLSLIKSLLQISTQLNKEFKTWHRQQPYNHGSFNESHFACHSG